MIKTSFGEPGSNYSSQLNALADWFAERVAVLPPIVMTRGDYFRGVDALTGEHAALVKEVDEVWGRNGYRLSYNQMCVAFYDAVRRVGKLEVIG